MCMYLVSLKPIPTGSNQISICLFVVVFIISLYILLALNSFEIYTVLVCG